MTDPLGLLSPLRNTFKWDRRFTRRQLRLYGAADVRVYDTPFPNRNKVQTFLGAWLSLLDPPCCNFEPLREFLERNSEIELENPTSVAVLSTLALIDDRRDPAGLKPAVVNQPAESNGQTRDWESEAYSSDPTEGENIWRGALNERELYNRLVESVSIDD
jgi:hypothetical protein